MGTTKVGRLRMISWCFIPFATATVSAMANQSTDIMPTAGNDSAALGEIIVTAQKRAENIQNVPISISVLGGRDLDKLTFEGVTDALNSVPGVAATVGFQGGATQISVRGVSAAGPLFDASNSSVITPTRCHLVSSDRR